MFGCFLCLCVLFETYRVVLYGVFICVFLYVLFLFFSGVVHVGGFVCCVGFIAGCCLVGVLCVLLCVPASVITCLCVVCELLCDVV